MPKWNWQRMQGVHVAVGCSIKTSADYTVWGGLVEEPGSETCKEIETTRWLLKEHSTQTLTASHSEHEAIKTWSGKLPSLYFTQQENLGCPGWQNNIRPPKSSQGLSHSAQAYCSAGTQNIQHRPDWIFHCFCGVWAGKKNPLFWRWTCSVHTSDVLCSPPQDGGKLVSVSADSDTPADRSAYMHPCVTWCQRSVWQVETETGFRWAACCSVAPRGDPSGCHTADVL